MLPGLAFRSNSTFCPHIVFMCSMWICKQATIVSLYSINCLVFIAKYESVFCAIRTESLNIVRLVSVFKGLMKSGA
jgi:hypothetical protein